MINFQALNVLLDTLRKADPRPPPVARVLALRPTLRTAADGSSAANDLRASTPGAPSRSPVRDFPLAPDPTSGGRLRGPATNARVAAQVLLSAGGAELERALRGSGGRLPAAPTVRSAAPLTDAAPPARPPQGAAAEMATADDRVDVARSVMTLALALRDAVAQSGLFYESHLARWIADDYTQSELDREPQAGVAGAPGNPGGHAAAGANAGTGIASAPAPAAADAPADATGGAGLLSLVDAGTPASAQNASPGIVSRADHAPLLRQQLDVLDTRQFVWVGEAWPGLRTAIRFEQDREHQAAQDPASAGRTLIRAHVILELPELGTVGAELAIIQGCVHLQITTDGPASTQRLHAARAELAEALAARALPAAEIAVFDAL